MKNIKLVINNDLRKEKEKFFIKRELQSILNLYAKMVSSGTWKQAVGMNFLLLMLLELFMFPGPQIQRLARTSLVDLTKAQLRLSDLMEA